MADGGSQVVEQVASRPKSLLGFLRGRTTPDLQKKSQVEQSKKKVTKSSVLARNLLQKGQQSMSDCFPTACHKTTAKETTNLHQAIKCNSVGISTESINKIGTSPKLSDVETKSTRSLDNLQPPPSNTVSKPGDYDNGYRSPAHTSSDVLPGSPQSGATILSVARSDFEGGQSEDEECVQSCDHPLDEYAPQASSSSLASHSAVGSSNISIAESTKPPRKHQHAGKSAEYS